MRVSKIPYDLTAEFRAWHAAARRRRMLAWAGTAVVCVLTGTSLGAIAAQTGAWAIIGGSLALGWGVWSLHYLITRH